MTKAHPGRDTSQRGVVLMVTVLLLAVLLVLVVQFSYSTLLDRLMAHNEKVHLQNQLHLDSALALCQKYGAKVTSNQDFSEGKFQASLDENTTVEIHFYDESGRFNLNAIITESSRGDRAARMLQLRRLLTLIGETSPAVALSISSVIEFVENRQQPLQSLRELQGAFEREEIDESFLTSISRFIAVNEEKKINVRVAPTEVMRSLAPGLSAQRAQRLRQYYLTKEGGKSIKRLAERLDRYTTLSSSSYGAEIGIKSRGDSRNLKAGFNLDRRRRRLQLRSLEDSRPTPPASFDQSAPKDSPAF